MEINKAIKAAPIGKLHSVSSEVIELMRKADLHPDEVMNIMLNLLARSAILLCMERKELLEALGLAYDLHIADESNNNETLN